MLQLNQLQSIVKKRKRVGRGGSRGGNSGRGSKGQLSRPGGRSEIKPFFEGGQMPLSRRLPKRGFKNVFKNDITVLNLKDLEARFEPGETVNLDILREKRLLKRRGSLVKILGSGELNKRLVVHVHAVSASALSSIQKAGGEVILLGE